MFLLNINGCNAPSTLDVFTIQNVPIKWDTGKYKGLGADNLQYKMFLLNSSYSISILVPFEFTIQNVPIKSYLQPIYYLMLFYLQYKMFLLNKKLVGFWGLD